MDDDYIRRGAFVLGIDALSTTDAHLQFLCTTEIKAPVDSTTTTFFQSLLVFTNYPDQESIRRAYNLMQ